MRKWQSRCLLHGACITMMTTGLLAYSGLSNSFAATSSCVQCHTDEDMLEENLTTVKAKGSAMQSGAG